MQYAGRQLRCGGERLLNATVVTSVLAFSASSTFACCSNLRRPAEEPSETTFPELFAHQLRYLGVLVGTPEIPMIDHDHAIKLAAKCRDLSRQLDPHGSWPFMIEIAETIEELIADRVLNHCHLNHHEKAGHSDYPEPIIKVANF